MSYKRTEISPEKIENQLALCGKIRELVGETRLAKVDTYGCQQNEADSEQLRGYLLAMGYGITEDERRADVVVFNTCAVREHAEQRVFGNVGALNHTKKANPNQVIVVCGCMGAQESVAQKLRQSYPIVDLVFAPSELWRFPELMLNVLTKHKRVFALGEGDGAVVEGIPHNRTQGVSAWLSIMYGCNNFCSYCIVPYTRFRERSRKPEDIIAEARQLVTQGFKTITLLGQNVNSYGKDLENCISFARLIREINAIPGDFIIRFMTSHPKDATRELFAAMADCEKCEKHLHLPLQSGSDRILKVMNRRYDSATYLEKVRLAREYMPELVITTDIIVGFPNETEEDFQATMEVVEKVGYDAMFTFIYSKRTGTPAAEMEDPFTREEKQVHFDRLLALQNDISEKKHRAYIGQTHRVLLDGLDKEEGFLTARTIGGRLVRVKAPAERIGEFVQVRITDSNTWALKGEII